MAVARRDRSRRGAFASSAPTQHNISANIEDELLAGAAFHLSLARSLSSVYIS